MRKAALLLAILLFVLLPAGCGSPASPADTSGFITLSSEITELEPGLSAVRHEGDYGFDLIGMSLAGYSKIGDISGYIWCYHYILENAVTVRIGLGESKNWQVDMVDNAAANTMLGYLTASELRFPTYTYDDEAGYVAQRVRGSYTRDDEITVPDPKCGELYLFSDGQLRFYYKDAPETNITATPVGTFADTDGLTEAVQQAYTDNLDDVWNVNVYFLITKKLE